MGSRLPRAAEQERGEQEERRRAQRPPADHRHLRQARLRLDRPRRPARPDALVRALHAAPARHRRRQDRHPRARGARRPLLHAPRPHRRRPASTAQLRVIADISVKYARGTADVTDRQNIQLHWIEIESVPAIWEALEAVGPVHHGGLRRHAPGHPGLPARRPRHRRAHRRDAARSPPSPTRYIGDPALSNLPRKFKTSISGCAAQCTHHEINDVAFVGVRHPETGEGGFDLWVGGGLSTNPMLAKRLGAFVPAGQVPEVWAASAASSATTATGGCGTGPGSSS